MRNLYLLLLLGAAACTRQPADHFVLRGTVPGAMDSTQVILKMAGGWETALDTAYVVGEKFELRGKLGTPTLCRLALDNFDYLHRSGKDLNLTRHHEIDFFVENGNLVFSTPHIDSLPKAFWLYDIRKEKNYKVEGSAAQDAYCRYQQQTLPLRYDLKRIRGQWNFPDRTRKMEEIKAEMEKVSKAFIRNNSNLAVNLYVAGTLKKPSFTFDQAYLDELEQLFASCQDTCIALKEFRQYLHDASRLVQGSPLQQCELVTPQGKTVELLRQLNPQGYTLIDFWASWCIPCRVSLVHLRELYKQYGKQVRFISLSLDQKEPDWQKALKEEKLPWTQFRSLPEQTQKFAEQYNLYGIPTFFLVDREGRIVFSGSESESLQLQLEKIYTTEH